MIEREEKKVPTTPIQRTEIPTTPTAPKTLSQKTIEQIASNRKKINDFKKVERLEKELARVDAKREKIIEKITELSQDS